MDLKAIIGEPTEREIFLGALERATPEERAAFLDGACVGKPRLRAAVEALLAHHAEDKFLEEPADQRRCVDAIKSTVIIPVTEGPGDYIGPYKLREKLGEGGCGVVYVAEQEKPVRRRVALKVIKLGMDTREVIARFEAERQALAMMDHPNIAKVLDAGATAKGSPYFVMELVRGIRITDYCDHANLSTGERLGLFIKVCQAIQHAHQKGIIHRDIKPSNILVTLHDGEPVPKVIDFGIAKATEGRLTDATIYTQLHQFIGTPAYMSPEQAEMSGLDIDTRSDIYALGVLLYELLTGKTPFDARELLSLGVDEMRRTIREKEPLRPSTRLASLSGQELTTTAKRRACEVPRLLHLLKGDLDWIVMKALEKDRRRRYETANHFAEDIRRHLDDQPVNAGPPSVGYRFGKFVKRNRIALSVTVTVVLLASALAVSAFLLYKEFQAGKFGAIAVNSNPEGAEVWQDGQRVGVTPFRLASIHPGEFTYSLVLNDYEAVTNTTTVAAKKQMNDFTFLRRTAPLSMGLMASARTNEATPGLVGRGNPSVVAVDANVPRTNSAGLPPTPAAVDGTKSNAVEFTAAAPQGAVVLTAEGKVEVARRGTSVWTPALTNQVLTTGDRLRTGSRSRASVRFSDHSMVRINELTVFEIRPAATNKPSLQLKNGSLYFFHRDAPTNLRIITPGGTAGVSG